MPLQWPAILPFVLCAGDAGKRAGCRGGFVASSERFPGVMWRLVRSSPAYVATNARKTKDASWPLNDQSHLERCPWILVQKTLYTYHD